MTNLNYQSGFGNHFASEALPNVLPQGQNSPQKINYGLYAEQISGSAFTAAKGQNQRTWFYRIHPSVLHSQFQPHHANFIIDITETSVSPTQMRWDPLPFPEKPTTFIEGWFTFAKSGNPRSHQGATTYLYACNKNMGNQFFYSADGELLIIPQIGKLLVRTELGLLHVEPEEILVIPRGIKFQVHLLDEKARGYICENHGFPFRLPERGPIGANGLANERDFLYPIACYEDIENEHTVVCKFLGNLWQATLNHSPLDVVGWHGNYVPYKYALKNFNTLNSVSFDHSDPSIFTVLTSPSTMPGTANVDFVIFPERWSVAEHTFRPPYFHRNIMSELMGLIKGVYDAKTEGFHPGGISIHNCMIPHGPDANSFEINTSMVLKPKYIRDTLAFMLESSLAWIPSKQALTSPFMHQSYLDCWKGFKKNFKLC